ncbi:hypothetical protein KB1253_23690 [Lactiplantibacillus plantarum]|uniref:hypothetical protein n=1 Tax=Lactobacillaceae TaxID=33958 RepID=UPI000FD7A5A9|nr:MULTISPECIES: hypothetical protein [Lactobacillaceae]GCD87211.1 hypothetical protein KB1253_23690 [Lactiplantibacillus plantarum]GEB75573.1 hypothetical protein LBR04_23120 [Levilactobacillus brevis]
MKRTVFFTLVLSFIIIFPSVQISADTTPNYQNYYQQTYIEGTQSGIIKENYSNFVKQCDIDLAPAYLNFIKGDGNLTFPEFAKENNYDQGSPEETDTQNIAISSNTKPNSLSTVKSAASKAKIKSGDMLICHGTNSSGKFLGHEAIATSGNYVLEMRGPEGAKNNNYHTPITTFFKNHLKKTGDYIQVYWIKSHPNYSSDAAKYAYNHMYISNKINYLTTTNLYHKNPSYCSKYVYLAYWWGTSHKGMKGGLMWVFPFSMANVFSGTYKPSYIYKLTTK